MSYLSMRRFHLKMFALSGVTASLERLSSTVGRATMVDASLHMGMSCKRLDALSTLLTAHMVDVIGDDSWIEKWKEIIGEWAPGAEICDLALEVQDKAENVVLRAMLAIEWFHTMQHAEQNGKPPAWANLRQEADPFEAIEKGDPELALSIMVGNWLAEHGDSEDPRNLDVLDDGVWDHFSPVVDAIYEYMKGPIVEHINNHLEAMEGVEEGTKTDEEAAVLMQKVNERNKDKIDKHRVNRSKLAVEAIREEDQKENPLLGLLDKLEKRIAQDLRRHGTGGDVKMSVMNIDPKDGTIEKVGEHSFRVEQEGDDNHDREPEPVQSPEGEEPKE